MAEKKAEKKAAVKTPAVKKTVGKMQDRPTRRSDTFRALEGLFDREEYVADESGVWPEVLMWKYDRVGSADIQAWRIRHGRIALPDHDGGDRGVWEARVVNEVKGDSEREGPGVMYVRYVGVMVGE